MRIGIVTTWFERGAAYVSRLYKKVLEKDHDVFVYARGGERYAVGDPGWDGPEVTWATRTGFPVATALNLREFESWIVTKRLEVVFFNEQHWWPPVILCNRLGIITGAYIDYYTEPLIPLFGCYDFLICNTRRHYSVFTWHPCAIYIPWGTDINVYRPSRPGLAQSGHLTFFHSAGMNPLRKGTDQLLRAFADIDGPARLVVHTQRSIEETLPTSVPLVARLTAQGRLRIVHATVPEPGLYHLGDVYVYPARLDGIGLTVPEALASGLPSVVPDNAPMNEFLNTSAGQLIRVERLYCRADGYYWPQCLVSEEHLSQLMQWYIDNMERFPEFRMAARDAAVAELDWYKNAAGLPRFFTRCSRVTGPLKESALSSAEVFERNRFNLSFRYWLRCRWPDLFE